LIKYLIKAVSRCKIHRSHHRSTNKHFISN